MRYTVTYVSRHQTDVHTRTFTTREAAEDFVTDLNRQYLGARARITEARIWGLGR